MSQYPSIPSLSGQAEIERVNRAFSRLLKYYRALDCGHFRPVESTLIRHVIERGWYHPVVTCGLSEAMPVPVSCAVLHSMYRAYHENDFRRALATLRNRRVLLLQEDRGYLVNRDYRDWRNRDGAPLLSADDLATVEASTPGKPSLAVVGEFPAGQTSDLPAPPVVASGGILDDSGAASAGACSEPPRPSAGAWSTPPDQAPALADQAPALGSEIYQRNESIDRGRVAGFVDEDLSYSSIHSESESHSFCSEVRMSLSPGLGNTNNAHATHANRGGNNHALTENHTAISETYIHQKEKNLWGPPTRNGHDDACMEPAPIADSTVEADPIPGPEPTPAAPSTNGDMPASMLVSIPGEVTPDPALWADLEYMLAKFLPCNHYEQQFSYYRNVYETHVMVGALKRCLLKKKGINNFFYILATMRTWAGPEEERHYDRDLRPVRPAAAEAPGPGPVAPAAGAAPADPHAEYRANHSPAMLLEWMKDNNVSMENNPPKKDSPNGKLMDEDDYNRRLAIRARDPDRFRSLAMSKYCPSLILETGS